MVRGVPDRIYYYQHHKVLEEVIPRSIVLVACADDNPDQILGWICAETVNGPALVIHYVYVKYAMRKWGIAKQLVQLLQASEQPVAVFHTHRTKAGKSIVLDKKLGWIYNPYLLFQDLPESEDAQG